MKKEIGQRVSKDIKKALPAVAIIVTLWVLSDIVFGAFCPSVVLAGMPCPSCGMTRAVLCLFTGRFRESLQFNPMAVFWLAAGGYYLLCRQVLGRKAKGMGLLFLILCLVSLMVFLVRFYLFYPGAEPLCYHPGNLLERFLPFYRSLMESWQGVGNY